MNQSSLAGESVAGLLEVVLLVKVSRVVAVVKGVPTVWEERVGVETVLVWSEERSRAVISLSR